MNDSEKRRRQLLEETRSRYSDRWNPPAIHPRYGSTYRKIYGLGEKDMASGTFGIRLFLCFMLFAAYVTMDNNQLEYRHVDSKRIVQEITTDMDVTRVWENL